MTVPEVPNGLRQGKPDGSTNTSGVGGGMAVAKL